MKSLEMLLPSKSQEDKGNAEFICVALRHSSLERRRASQIGGRFCQLSKLAYTISAFWSLHPPLNRTTYKAEQ
jgi:hypothetical protein